MLRNLKISTRLIVLIVIQIVVLAVIGATSLVSLNVAGQTMANLNQYVVDQVTLNRLGETVRQDLLATVNEMYLGTITWEEAGERLAQARANFAANWQTYLETLTPDEAELVQDIHGPTLEDINTAMNELEALFEARDRTRLGLFITNDFGNLVEPYFNALQARAGQQQFASAQDFQAAQEANRQFLTASAAIIVLGTLIAGILGVVIYRSIAQPIGRMTDTVHKLAEGDYDVRTGIEGRDELGELGQAFDRMLAERVATLSQVERENEQLNESVINLLQAVSQLSQRDLTVRVAVTEDVTGPVADALNLLTGETSKVLAEVTRISDQVAQTCALVKAQSDSVIAVASGEQEEVERTAGELTAAAAAMNRIAELAQTCNNVADNAIRTTQQALETVTRTVEGINSTRDIIRETEKRIKRLGDRSQEISGAVNLINSIAERTHILALNASMHAASAGEAGRGFAVVADEVQRLAENARRATSEIATLVSNIQAETADTANTMNAAISQVVDGSRLAEQAGDQMKTTQQTTAELVASVQQIARESLDQARATNTLLERARAIQDSTRQTSQQLEQQTERTNTLVEYARVLVDSVRVFKLPPEVTEDNMRRTA